MAKTHSYMPDDCKELCKALTSVSDRYSTWQVFEDWLKISSISISNAVDLQFRDEREKEYFEIIKKYNKDELNRLRRITIVNSNYFLGPKPLTVFADRLVL